MAYADANRPALDLGQVFDGTISVLGQHIRPFAIYVGVFTIVGTLIEWGASRYAMELANLVGGLENYQLLLQVGAGFAGLAIFFIALIGQYWLWRTLLNERNLGDDRQPHRYFAFLLQSIVLGIAITFGYLLLIVPGLLFTARWSMAPALLIGENRGIVEAMGYSWEAIRGNSTPIVLAYIIVGFGFFIVAAGLGAAAVGTAVTDGGISSAGEFVITLLTQALSHTGTAMAIALGIFLFGWAYGETTAVSNVFE